MIIGIAAIIIGVFVLVLWSIFCTSMGFIIQERQLTRMERKLDALLNEKENPQ